MVLNINSIKADKVFLVHDGIGYNAVWHYVLVDSLKLPVFRKKIGREPLELKDYGKVLYSGRGEQPPEELKKKLHQEFDVDYIG